ncbi:hypothetical protein [Sphingomonas sp. RS2018]
MRLFYLILVTIFTVAATPQKGSPTSPTLWNGITKGMSVAQIVAEHPGAIIKDGKVFLPQIAVDGTVYRPEIKISDGRAMMVTLRPERWTSRELITALSSKYGQPVNQWECTNRNGAEDCQAAWRGRRGLRITLTYLGLFGQGAIEITYIIVSGEGL